MATATLGRQSATSEGVYDIFDPVRNQQFAQPEWVRLSEIEIPGYQRLRDDGRVERIMEGFHPAKARYPQLVQRQDGTLVCKDGQHTLMAFIGLGYEYAWCAVSSGLSLAEEAELFASQQENVKTPSPAEQAFAYAEAAAHGSSSAEATMFAAIMATLGSVGWKLDRTKGKGKADCSRQMTVITTTGLQKVYETYGLNVLAETLDLINEIWGPGLKTPGNEVATRPRFIEAMAHLAQEYRQEITLRPEIKQRLRTYPIEYVEKEAKGMANQGTKAMTMAEFLRGNVLADYKLPKRGVFRKNGKRPK